MKTFSKILIAGCTGAVIGTVTGILFAKKTGSETRKNISDSLQKASGKIKHVYEKVSGKNNFQEDGRSHGVENEINEYVS